MNSKKTYSYSRQSISWADIWEVVKVLRSPWLTQGPKIQDFEQALCDYTGARYAVVVANATVGLYMAVRAAEINPGDHGITSPITFLASANCIQLAGGKAQFADIEKATANINPEEIKKQITSKTKVLIPVHFAGQSCDMEQIWNIAKQHNVVVIEDAAHAIGSHYKGKKVGSCQFSDMTVFSFHPVKNITTGEGGAITTNNKELYEKLLTLRTHGMIKDPQLLTQNDGPWYYQIQEPSLNFRMTDIQAALGISQLKRLDTFAQKRRNIVYLYRQALAHDQRFSLLEEKQYSKAAFHLCPLLINFDIVKKSKKDIFEELKSHGLHLQIHYIPVHTQPFYKAQGFKEGDFPVAEQYYQKTLSLPLYYDLKNSDVKKIITIIKETIV
ncbi:MAG: UDP-4-amino-4,6-dideoxy-N-acetyl-beta-L-altrosamine transaminase [bacterium]